MVAQVKTGMNSPGGPASAPEKADRFVPPPRGGVRPSARPEHARPVPNKVEERVFHSRYRSLRITFEIGEEKHLGGNRFRKTPNTSIQFEDRGAFGEFRTTDPKLISFLTGEYKGYDAIGRDNALCWDANAREEEGKHQQYDGFVQTLAQNPELVRRLAEDLATGKLSSLISDDVILEAMASRPAIPTPAAISPVTPNTPKPDVG